MIDCDTTADKTALAFGALLHDIGKIVYRGSSERKTHAVLGADFIQNEVASVNEGFSGVMGAKIVEQIRYHHARDMAHVSTALADDSLAFVTYFADNISAGMDRKDEGDAEQARYFDRNLKLRKIFNILNDRHDDNVVEHEDYNSIRERIKSGLANISVSPRGVNSLLNLLEATTSTVPSSTDVTQLADVSLFDHAKTTAAIASCVYEYLDAQGATNYRAALFDRHSSDAYWDAPIFLMYSFDMSGIQSFIYNISGSGALKQLRARSFYLEMLIEHIADELLDRLQLSRANLLYTGGGHAYILLSHTERTKAVLAAFEDELAAWLLEHYRTDLYLASASVECCANDLANRGADKQRYADIYRELSRKLSDVKAARYSASTIRTLNFAAASEYDHSRECSECHRSDADIDADGKCPLCATIGALSNEVVFKDVFAVRHTTDVSQEGRRAMPLPFGCMLEAFSREEYLCKKPKVVRIYTKNSWDTGLDLATHIWVGDYCAQNIERFASCGVTLREGCGIERLGVLRADVDDLGAAFASGIPAEKASISRTATLSRQLGYFFKHQINEILAAGGESHVDGEAYGYQVRVIYSGGDDLFIVGNWSDIIYAAMDIRRAFVEFTGNGSLTLSVGIGMFWDKYPIARMAEETGRLEDAAKMHTSEGGAKNAVALWSTDRVFGWDEFTDSVEPRESEVSALLAANEKGKAFAYKIVGLLRDFDDVASAPRLAYLLARSFEDAGDRGTQASRKFYDWAMDENERRYFIAALEWYAYSTRERG